MRIVLLGCLVASGCAFDHIRVSAYEVQRHAQELRTTGEATVIDRSGEELVLHIDERVRPIERERRWLGRAGRQSLRGLLAGCPARCGLTGLRSLEIERVDWGQSVFGWTVLTLTLSAIGGLFYCGAECEGTAQTVSLIGLTVLSVGMGIVFAIIAAPFS